MLLCEATSSVPTSISPVFLTESCHQIHLIPTAETELCFWRQVTIASASCRLLVEAFYQEGDSEFRNRTLLSAPSELEGMAQQYQISHVGLLSPGHANCTGHWALDAVAELWRCAAPLPGGQTSLGWIHVLADGREVFDCAGLNEMFEFRRTTLVYSAQAQTVCFAAAH